MPPAEFALTEESIDDDRHVVAVRGEIDLFTAPDLKATLLGAIDAGKSRIVVDLTETAFLDSTALGVLIGAVKRVRGRDGALTIVNTDPNIAKTFEITGLDQIFTITATRDEAIAALDGDPQSVWVAEVVRPSVARVEPAASGGCEGWSGDLPSRSPP